MANLDLSKLSPSDAQTALRSYPRRFQALFEPREGEDIDEIAHRIGPDGDSAITVVSDLDRTWTLLRDALLRITTTDTPVLHAAVVDAGERVWQTPPPDTVVEALTMLADEAYAFADAIDHVSTLSWDRTASVADSSGVTSVSALDVVMEAVQVGHMALGHAEAALAAARR
jgi:hypothetical protein